VWVTLHRVGSVSAGPLDSARTDAGGAYALRYRTFGAPDAIYFASARYGGVAYFTHPLRAAVTRGDDAEIDVFDTTSTRVPTTVRGRHVIVAAPDKRGTREVIEVYEISNDSSVTMVDRERAATAAATGTWSAAIPARGVRFQVRAGEVPEDALLLEKGRAVLHMPLAPGLKQVAFSYSLPADAFPLTIDVERRTSVLEVLIEDPHGTASGPRLTGVDPVTVEGRQFRRYLGQDVPAGGRVAIEVPADASWVRWMLPGTLALVGLAMVSALAFPRRRRALAAIATGANEPVTEPAVPLDDRAAEIARRIAALDDEFERGPVPSDDARSAYERRRAELKAELAALAGVEVPR
jgi:hypothetical protein